MEAMERGRKLHEIVEGYDGYWKTLDDKAKESWAQKEDDIIMSRQSLSLKEALARLDQDELTTCPLRIDKDLWAQLLKLCDAKGVSISNYVHNALELSLYFPDGFDVSPLLRADEADEISRSSELRGYLKGRHEAMMKYIKERRIDVEITCPYCGKEIQ